MIVQFTQQVASPSAGGLQTARSEGPSELVSIGVEDCPPSGGYRASIGSHIWDLCPYDCR